jgi:hypothetical protein
VVPEGCSPEHERRRDGGGRLHITQALEWRRKLKSGGD